MKKTFDLVFLVVLLLGLVTACSPSKFATEMAIDALTGAGSSTVFSGESDPELAAQSLPFALKMYEALLVDHPDHPALLSAAGEGFVSYANAFCQLPASMESSWEKQRHMLQRAASLYLRGRDYALRALETRHDGCIRLLDEKRYDEALGNCSKEDVSDLYWAAAGWFGAISAEGFNMRRMAEAPTAYALLVRALCLDEGFNYGALHELAIAVLPALPEAMRYRPNVAPADDPVRTWEADYYHGLGIDPISDPYRAAYHHFERSLKLGEEGLVSPFVTYAEGVCVPQQDYEGFRAMLEKGLAVDMEKWPDSRLVNILQEEKARWLLAHAEDFFVVIPDEQSEE